MWFVNEKPGKVALPEGTHCPITSLRFQFSMGDEQGWGDGKGIPSKMFILKPIANHILHRLNIWLEERKWNCPLGTSKMGWLVHPQGWRSCKTLIVTLHPSPLKTWLDINTVCTLCSQVGGWAQEKGAESGLRTQVKLSPY